MPRVKRYEETVPVLEAELLEAIERDRIAARALDLEAAQRIQDIRRQAAATQGFDAETAVAGARKAIAETRAEFAGRATSPRMRAMLEDVLERRAALVDDELTAHTERARTAALIDGALQRRQLARQDAHDAITPHAFDIHHQTMLDAIDEHGRLVGLDPAEIAANRLRASSAVHADRTAARLDAGDVDGAIAWRDANRGVLSAADAARLESLLAEPAARARSASRVDRLMGAGTREAAPGFSYADPLHGAGRGAVAVVPGDEVAAIPADPGTPVYATGPGVATLDGADGIVVTHEDGSQTRYAGLSDPRVQDGDAVTPDTLLATVAADAVPQLRYSVWHGGQPLDPAEVASRIARFPNDIDFETVYRAIADHPDAGYSIEDRTRDQAEARRRADAFASAPGFGNPDAALRLAGFGSAGGGQDVPATADEASRELLVTGDPQFAEMTDAERETYHELSEWLAGGAGATPASGPVRTAGRYSRPALGSLSAKHESRGGVGTVSGGLGDRGGASYGTYQMTSQVTRTDKNGREFAVRGGTVRQFIGSPYGQPWRAEFRGLQEGSTQYTQKWKEIAQREPGRFGAAQHEFIKASHFDGAVAGVKAATKFDLETRSEAVQNATWSVAVQHGRAVGSILVPAIRELERRKIPPEAENYDELLIRQIYAERTRYVAGQLAAAEKTLLRMPPKAPGRGAIQRRVNDFRSIIRKRYPTEEREALAMLKEQVDAGEWPPAP